MQPLATLRALAIRASIAGAVALALPASSSVIQIGPEDFRTTGAIGFEDYYSYLYLSLGDIDPNPSVRFPSTSPDSLWFLTTYSGALATAANDLGLGARGALLTDADLEVTFPDGPTRVGFFLGALQPTVLPVRVRALGEVTSEDFEVVVPGDSFAFFGFADPEGIESIRFGTDFDHDVMLDGLRYDIEPVGSVELIGLGGFAGDDTLLSFEDVPVLLDPENYIPEYHDVGDRYAQLGVVFDEWLVGHTYEGWGGGDYLPVPLAQATALGAGVNTISAHLGARRIRFDPPVRRVGFYYADYTIEWVLGARTPVTFLRDGVQLGTYSLVSRDDQLSFFGFEDPGGIGEIHINGTGALDLLRFAPEPGALLTSSAACVALAGLARRRRTPPTTRP